jgi:hypothetical protein
MRHTHTALFWLTCDRPTEGGRRIFVGDGGMKQFGAKLRRRSLIGLSLFLFFDYYFQVLVSIFNVFGALESSI